jgi:hypothetical protein
VLLRLPYLALTSVRLAPPLQHKPPELRSSWRMCSPRCDARTRGAKGDCAGTDPGQGASRSRPWRGGCRTDEQNLRHFVNQSPWDPVPVRGVRRRPAERRGHRGRLHDHQTDLDPARPQPFPFLTEMCDTGAHPVRQVGACGIVRVLSRGNPGKATNETLCRSVGQEKPTDLQFRPIYILKKSQTQFITI